MDGILLNHISLYRRGRCKCTNQMSLLIQLFHLLIPLMISGDNRETDPGGRTYTRTNQLLAYKRIDHSNLLCSLFQVIADMLGILVLTSLAAFGKNFLHLHPNKHTHTHLPSKFENLMPDSDALCPSFSVLAEAQPMYIEDQTVEERVVGGEVASPNSWPWQVQQVLTPLTSFKTILNKASD